MDDRQLLEDALRPKRDTVNPCAACGWSEHMAIHQPTIDGPRKGQPWGHSYVPVRAAAHMAREGGG